MGCIGFSVGREVDYIFYGRYFFFIVIIVYVFIISGGVVFFCVGVDGLVVIFYICYIGGYGFDICIVFLYVDIFFIGF